MNTFGNIFRLTTFGESHGVAVGAVVDGCPAGIPFDLETLRRDLARRRPGQAYTTERNELDEPEVLSGVFEGLTLGSPIAVIVRNHDQRSKDYNRLKDLYRPSHADYTYQQKYGVRDHRGGRSSARETLARVIGGSVAQMVLAEKTSIRVKGAVTTLGTIQTERPLTEMQVDNIYASPVRCDDPDVEGKMAEYLEQLRAEGDSTGGIVSIQVDGVEAGLGEPIYRKLNSILAAAMMSINGATGFEMGAGFAVANRRGSENNDQWSEGGGGFALRQTTPVEYRGISNGMPIVFRVAFKPPSSIAKEQTHGTTSGETVEHTIAGRHDPSIVIRALPVVEAMTLLVLADMWLQSKAWS